MAQAAEDGIFYLGAIRFEGNKHTREAILLQEMRLRPGQRVRRADIEAARQAVMDLGLFKSVRASLEEGEEGQVLVITVQEKYYILPAPILDGDPRTQDVEYGLELRLDNLMGLNQRVRLSYAHEDASDDEVPKRDEYRLSYSYPRVIGTPYTVSLDTRLNTEELNARDEADALGRYQRNRLNVSLGASRWLFPQGPSAGWRGGLGVSYASHTYDHVAGVADLFVDAKAVSLDASLGHAEVHEHSYYRTGAAYGWNGTLGLPELGSDFSFTRHLFYLRLYHRLPEQDANINWQLRIGFGRGEVFDDSAYSIGGFATLRGYPTLRGNAMALSNLEYHQQIPGHPAVSAVSFLDLGNVYPEVIDMDPADLEAGIGFGLRWRVQFLVDVTIAADLGYGLGAGEFASYLGTRGSF